MSKANWRKVKFGEVVRLSKTRCQDPLAEGVERFFGLEHLEPGDLRIRRWGSVADGVTFTSVFKPGKGLVFSQHINSLIVMLACLAAVRNAQ